MDLKVINNVKRCTFTCAGNIIRKLTNLKDTNIHTYVSSAHFSRKHQTVLLRAGVHQLTGVDEGVFLHVGLLVEAFAAVLAGIGPGV